MENIRQFMGAIIFIMIFVALATLVSYAIARLSTRVRVLRKLNRFMIDYRFNQDGIEIIIFGRWVTARLQRKDIKETIIIRRWWDPRLLSPLIRRFRNNWYCPCLLIRTKSRWSWLITPENPEAALEALDWPSTTVSD